MTTTMAHRRHNEAKTSHAANRRERGFTLIELVVVMAIVLVLAGLVLPAASSMWEQRKLASAHTIIQGMLQTARSRAMRAGAVESGLFFFLGRDGVQRIASIQQDAVHSGDIAWENVFRITQDRLYTLPAPMRAVPRYVVDTNPVPQLVFSEEELARKYDDFENLDAATNNAQRHRNFFTMVFSSEGQLLVRRDVLILDEDKDGKGVKPVRGDISGLKVGYDWNAGPDGEAIVASFFAQNDTIVPTKPTPPATGAAKLPFLIFDELAGDVAINFPSVDGLLVYDNSIFRSLDLAADKRNYLLESAQPFYVNRYTGAIIRGPLGENVP
ncbi:MAG: prepilin-type N-terminal cleavage/methylation domain-containing protein [Planctomycetes bacterium]|nr:prepilin-type N-terminal cleavage/methylation domain-containing protein [Planctomycetota bacterium]